jgi:hypothetical protein
MAKDVEVNLNVKNNVEGSIAELKKLKKQLKDTEVGTEAFKNLYNQIDDLEDKIKSAKNVSSDWVDSLASAGGPIGTLGTALNSAKVATQSFSGALKATGIGLLVSLVGGLVAAFNDSEKATKKLQPLFLGLEKIFNGVFSAIEPLFNTLVDLAISALPLVSKAMQVVYGSVTAVIQSLGSLGSSVLKFIKGDFSGAWNDAKSSVNDFGKNYDESIKRFQDGSKELTKTEKEEAEKRKKAREEADKILKQKKEEERLAELARLDARLNAVRTYEANIAAEEIDAENERKKRAAEKQAQIEQENNAELNSYATYMANITAEEEKNKEASKKIAEEKQKAQTEALMAIAQSFSNASSIIGQETAVGKGLAVASATISTFVAAQAAYENAQKIPYVGSFLAPINAGLAIAAGLKNVQSILDIDVPGSSGGAVSGGNAFAGGAQAPRFNVVGASTANQVAQAVGGNIPPVRAYVVANDVTSQQALDRSRVSAATLG